MWLGRLFGLEQGHKTPEGCPGELLPDDAGLGEGFVKRFRPRNLPLRRLLEVPRSHLAPPGLEISCSLPKVPGEAVRVEDGAISNHLGSRREGARPVEEGSEQEGQAA